MWKTILVPNTSKLFLDYYCITHASKYHQILNKLLEYPITVDEKGAKIKPELMERDKLYHCMFKNKVLLFFKDEQDFLNCYEIEEDELVEKIKICNNTDEVAKILENYTQKHNLNN